MTADPAPETAPADEGPGLPLTAAQTGMWLAHTLDEGSPALNTAECVALDGPLDPAVFRTALHRTLTECEPLWVRITGGAEPHSPEPSGSRLRGPRQFPVPVPAVPDPAAGFPYDETDLRGEDDPEAAAEARMRADLGTRCDLAAGPPFRAALHRVGERRWLWYQRVHHAVLDGYGYSLVARRVAETYRALLAGRDPGPSPLRPLAELLAEDAAYRASDAFTADRDHWSRRLSGLDEAAAGPDVQPSRTFHRRSAHLPPEATARLKARAAELRATWPELLLAVQALSESRETRSEEVVLGVPMMCRSGTAALRVPGMAMNVLPLRLRLPAGATFAQLVRQVVLGLRELRRHQRYRYEDIRRDTGATAAGRALTGTLVNTMPFDYALDFTGCRATPRNLSAGPVEHLTVNIHDRGDGTGLHLDHDANPALHDEPGLAARQERFLQLVARLTEADPHTPLDRHAVATDAELDRVLREFNDTRVDLPPTTLIGPVEAQAARTPHATALVADGRTLSYAELDTRANRLARELVLHGLRPGALAAVALPRSAHLVVALLAVLKAGGAYLPLDPEHPRERLRDMLEDAAPRCVLTDSATRPLLPACRTPVLTLDELDVSEHLPTAPSRPLTPRDPAYVIYTSGSTGRPKGVIVPHSAIDNRLRWMQAEYGLGPGDRVLQKTPAGFDVSVWEFFWPLREGAALHLAAPGAHRDPAALARTLREQRITTVHFVPSMLQAFLAEPGAAEAAAEGALRRVFCSGEALARETADRFHQVLPGVPLHNLYGPTEAAVDVTHHTCQPGADGPVPIGRPVWNTRLYILDRAGQPCPPGVAGELYLAGAQLATGYLGRPALTAERFVTDPFTARVPARVPARETAGAPGTTGSPGTTGAPATTGFPGTGRPRPAGWDVPEPGDDPPCAPPGDGRMYRTGDVARWLPDGSVEYLGRTDHQVKLRGLRIEPGETEAALNAEPEIAASCVLVREDRPGDQRLVGYVVPAQERRAPARGTEEATAADSPAPATVDTAALRSRLAARLPAHLVPNALVVLDDFPLTANGKLDRKALPAPDEPAGTGGGRAPRTLREEALTRIFAEVLGVPRVGVDDGFFDLGGTSLLAVRLVSRLRADLGTETSVGALFRAPSPAALAALPADGAHGSGDAGALDVLLPLRAGGTARPLFAVHPAGGLSWCYSGLLAPLGTRQPVIGLQARGLARPGEEELPGTMEQMAADYAEQLRKAQPRGPYRLLGWSVGGVLAHTVAVQLQEAGEEVELLALMDAYPSDQWRDMAVPDEADALRALLRMAGFESAEDGTLERAQVLRRLGEEGSALASLSEETLTAVTRVVVNNARLMRAHEHRRFDGDLVFFTATAPRAEHWLDRTAWRPYITGDIRNHDIPCLHHELTRPERLQEVARVLRAQLAEE
ncbi:amino acid adenylation domain-containing protein [Streptomyces cacaoi]